jgi:Glu-tRNA(Gln) amidotransferase subunit E-like FAD-binding protein
MTMNNPEMKKLMDRLKKVQAQVQNLIQDQAWVDQAKKYAERQGRELKKLITSDAAKIKQFLERERKEIERFQKNIPAEVAKLKKFLVSQKKEFESVIKTLAKTPSASAKPARSTKKVAKKKTSVTSRAKKR